VATPQSILGTDGTATVARMLHAADGRCSGLYFGTYDYSAACGIAAAFQSMGHPVGDSPAVHATWRLHARLVRRSLERGHRQGWDLHPAQLPTRYLATYAFSREDLPAAADRPAGAGS
jgi:hypothetical protein